MAEETKEKETTEEESSEEKTKKKKLPGKRLKTIPKDMLFSPGGVILVFLAILMEISDLIIPMSGIDSFVVELIPEIFFALFLKLIAGISFSAMIIPFIIERFDLLGIIPTWLKFFI